MNDSKKVLLIVVSIFSQTALSQTSVEDAIQRAETSCLKRDWKNETCEFLPSPPLTAYPYNRTVKDSLEVVANDINLYDEEKFYENNKKIYEENIKISENNFEKNKIYIGAQNNLILAGKSLTEKKIKVLNQTPIPSFLPEKLIIALKDKKQTELNALQLELKNWDKTQAALDLFISTLKNHIIENKKAYENFMIEYQAYQSKQKQRVAEAPEKIARFELFKRNFLNKVSIPSLNDCQKSCLMKCMTSHLLTYDLKWIEDQNLKDYEYFDKGVGVCNAYSVLGASLQKLVGIESQRITKLDSFAGNHAYMMVTIDQKRYYAEPQSDSCTYINFEH